MDIEFNVVESRDNVRRVFHGLFRTTLDEVIFAEANFPLMKIQEVQLSTITMKKSLRTTLANYETFDSDSVGKEMHSKAYQA